MLSTIKAIFSPKKEITFSGPPCLLCKKYKRKKGKWCIHVNLQVQKLQWRERTSLRISGGNPAASNVINGAGTFSPWIILKKQGSMSQFIGIERKLKMLAQWFGYKYSTSDSIKGRTWSIVVQLWIINRWLYRRTCKLHGIFCNPTLNFTELRIREHACNMTSCRRHALWTTNIEKINHNIELLVSQIYIFYA